MYFPLVFQVISATFFFFIFTYVAPLTMHPVYTDLMFGHFLLDIPSAIFRTSFMLARISLPENIFCKINFIKQQNRKSGKFYNLKKPFALPCYFSLSILSNAFKSLQLVSECVSTLKAFNHFAICKKKSTFVSYRCN